MHGLNKRRSWNNEKSRSFEQGLHEYNQWARIRAIRKENKYPVKNDEGNVEFSSGPLNQAVYHYE